MVQGICELAAVCAGLLGLIGAAATTGMPMWKVTAFIGENIVVMETRWEGLWMNCFRQGNIRMQCKVYDSLLFLPAELQASRGLMCCSLALSGLGLMVATLGLRCTSCFRHNRRVKSAILSVAGGMQLLASLCVFIPVSWTGHVIIRDFYDPLLMDAQRRELGEALYIGWVTGAFLFASGLLFIVRLSDKRSVDVERHPDALTAYQPDALMAYQPVRSLASLRSEPFQQQGPAGPRLIVPGDVTLYNSTERSPGSYQAGAARHSSLRPSTPAGSIYTPVNSFYLSQKSGPYALRYNPTVSYSSSYHPAPQTPVFIQYQSSRIGPASYSGSSPGVYI
ncbi:claudin-8-like [Syngnathus typhle]|uniref:claudin-8-like n=1 Tax=Syngnathus typhle TaxID=161592 RepID=UPI002A6A4A52|nr:claudin-8-like [Syngnathus typhle]